MLHGFGGYTVGNNDDLDNSNFYDIGLNIKENILGLSTMLQLSDKNLFYDDEGKSLSIFYQWRI